jgi:DNA topoisomerase I
MVAMILPSQAEIEVSDDVWSYAQGHRNQHGLLKHHLKPSFLRIAHKVVWTIAVLLFLQNGRVFSVNAIMIKPTRFLGATYLCPHLLLHPCRRQGKRWSHASTSTEPTTFMSPTLLDSTGSEKSAKFEQRHLVIVESPAKCATIEKILNDASRKNGNGPQIQYAVLSCMGHIRNLPKRISAKAKRGRKPKVAHQEIDLNEMIRQEDGASLFLNQQENESLPANASSSKRFPYAVAGIDLDSGKYTPSYEIEEAKRGVVNELKRAVQCADCVLLATDPDREGESMAWHLADVLRLEPADSTASFSEVPKKNSGSTKPYYRIRFSEITSQAILAAVRSTWNVSSSVATGSCSAEMTTIDDNLVAAQETRRILDRLAGYTVSPVLWRKIAPGLSAGRVQSVGLQMIVSRERERLAFRSVPYFDLKAVLDAASSLAGQSSARLTARLMSINGTAVANSGKDFSSHGYLVTDSSKQKYHLSSETDALYWVQRMNETFNSNEHSATSIWVVETIKESRRITKASRPYKTSTLQQEAARRLGLPVQQTMRAAQQLYESGLISYMRTDSTILSDDAHGAVESAIRSQFGPSMVESADLQSSNEKAKFSQEAHEAIRPAIQAGGEFLRPEQLPPTLQRSAVDLYRMIYQRTLAHRMPPLIANQTQITILGAKGGTEMRFRTSGRVVVSPGFSLLYKTLTYSGFDVDDDGEEGRDSLQDLPPLFEGQSLRLVNLTIVDHETQPPPRYSEASFIKELEALGVGRPSTYAGIVQILRDRAYVGNPASASDNVAISIGKSRTWTGSAISAMRAAGGRDFVGIGSARGPLVPSLSAFVVCSLLEKHCPTYVDPDFTARMENRLDLIASGDVKDNMSCEEQRITYLDEFYAGDNGLAAQIKRIDETVQASDARRAIVPSLAEDIDSSDLPVGLFVGPWGPFVQRISSLNESQIDAEKPVSVALPPSMAADISTIKPSVLRKLLATKQEGGFLLGQHPEDGRNIWLKTGKFGVFLQWGADKEEGTTTHSLPRNKASFRQIDGFFDDDDGKAKESFGAMLGVTLEEAVAYCGLPRVVSNFMGKPIVAAIGPYGPYLKYDDKYLSLKATDGDVLTIDAVAAEALVTNGIINKPTKLGRGVIVVLGEFEGKKVTVKTGRYGHYINWNRVNAQIPKEYLDHPEAVPFAEAWSLVSGRLKPTQNSKKNSKSEKKTVAGEGVPPRPKRPLSAYLHFCAARRSTVAESVKSLGEISKKLASLWAETSLEDRQLYERLAAEGKQQYEEKVREWEVNSQCARNSNEKTNSKESNGHDTSPDSKRKSRSLSAYMIFCRENRPKIVDTVTGAKLPFVETTQRLASLWRECDEAAKLKYQQMAALEKERSAAQEVEPD